MESSFRHRPWTSSTQRVANYSMVHVSPRQLYCPREQRNTEPRDFQHTKNDQRHNIILPLTANRCASLSVSLRVLCCPCVHTPRCGTEKASHRRGTFSMVCAVYWAKGEQWEVWQRCIACRPLRPDSRAALVLLSRQMASQSSQKSRQVPDDKWGGALPMGKLVRQCVDIRHGINP